MSSVREAYDRHAPVYDQVFDASQIRAEIWEIADRFFVPGTRLLDLGCGTGNDAIHFALRGVSVTAIDISPGMIARLKSKCDGAIHCEEADMRTYAPVGKCFDGVFSNLSALNCASDLKWLSRLSLSPGSHLVLTTLGRFYPLESAIFLLKGKPRLAVRRFRRSCAGVVEGVRFDVYFHGLRSIQDALGPRFELREVTGLRALRPIPDLEHLERFWIIRLLKPLDRWWCSHRFTAVCSDQFVSVWRYRGT